MTSRGAGRQDEGEQQTLGCNETVACLFGNLLALVEQLGGFLGKIRLDTRTLDLWQLGKFRLCAAQRRGGVTTGGTDQVGGQTLLVVEQHLQKMQGGQLLMTVPHGRRLCRLNETANAFRIFF